MLAAVSAMTEDSLWRLPLPALLPSGVVACPSEGSACIRHRLVSTTPACESQVHAIHIACRSSTLSSC